MAFEFVNVNISRLIVHEVYGRDPATAARPPNLSGQCSTVEGRARSTFLDRLTKALGTDSHCVEMDIADDSATGTFQLCGSLLEATNDREFTEISGTVATTLQRAQASAVIPGGICIVFTGTCGTASQRFVAIIKAEVQEGFRKRLNGSQLTLELIQDLFLTPQQKLYKIGVFLEETAGGGNGDARAADEFTAYVYDSNMSHSETATAAKYFAEQFLGCQVPRSAKHMTQKFYRLTKDFIEKHPDFHDARRVDLTGALYTYLKVAQNRTFATADFASHYLQGARERSAYARYMQAAEFPARSFQKDLSLIASNLRRVKLRFTSDVSVSAPADGFADKVQVDQGRSGGGYTTLRIQGHIRRS